jgi:hypothetical protein
MATQNGILGGLSFVEVQVLAEGHPAVVRSWTVKASQGTLAPGQLVAIDSTGLAVAYNPAYVPGQNDPPAPVLRGVALRATDTAKEAAVDIVVHGTVVKKTLCLAAGATPAAAVLDALDKLGVWPL